MSARRTWADRLLVPAPADSVDSWWDPPARPAPTGTWPAPRCADTPAPARRLARAAHGPFSLTPDGGEEVLDWSNAYPSVREALAALTSQGCSPEEAGQWLGLQMVVGKAVSEELRSRGYGPGEVSRAHTAGARGLAALAALCARRAPASWAVRS